MKRRFHGYDCAQTDDLIDRLSASCDALAAERDSLKERIGELQAGQREHELRANQELDDVLRELTSREREVSDLGREIRDLKREREQQQRGLERAGDELLQAVVAQQRHHDERAELIARIGRLEIRERVLVEQLAILKGELHQTRDPRAVLDRLVETLTEEARREAEVTLKKARAQADKIVRSAEKRGRELEEAVELRTSEDLQRHLGESLWTSRHTDPAPEP